MKMVRAVDLLVNYPAIIIETSHFERHEGFQEVTHVKVYV